MKKLYDNLPTLDLHTENRITARILVEDFIRDHFKIGNNKILIIHGIGAGILRKEVHKVLKKSNLVLNYQINIFNFGSTIIELKSNRL
ncbi:MAG: Smr/MutS family protein [Bacilli bacterium]